MVKELEKQYDYFLNKTTILFGATNSGKTTILLEMLYLLKDKIPSIFVFCPTSDSNKSFEGIVPDPFIWKDININKLEEIWARQEQSTSLYNTVNDEKNIMSIYSKIATEKDYITLKKYDTVFANTQNTINMMPLDNLEKTMKRDKHKKQLKEYKMRHYKNVISKNKTRLKNCMLNEQQKLTIKYLYFNPNCVIVLDDCGAVLNKFQKKDIMRKLFFQGRHNNITLILTLQDDLSLNSSIKKNAFVSIFTTRRCASSYFERVSNAFSKQEKETASSVVNEIFKKSGYIKLAYVRDIEHPFRFILAGRYGKFKFGSRHIWELCSKLKKSTDSNKINNLLATFKI